ncbi:pyridoxal-dependent decarboxylase [Demequina sp. SYSU T00068]|uniref:pyridoxal phosphate-dependent decarboxylase family protein n=1 Tax=Demequina lignilytica TaxID=3051663 RepID=UPI00262F03CA|nr:pyridoxal-dependent decarboxylase [Demequina sp. SYSU T00068]MDN4490126.1 pyridoxal-dependent decarboxylase [Demequina sp. SYSU T00068]
MDAPEPTVAAVPASLATRASLVADAARRAGVYLTGLEHRPVAPPADAVAALAAFRRPLQTAPRDARDVLAELDALGSPATMAQARGRYFGFVNGGVDAAAGAASVLAGQWDQNAALPVMSPVAAVLDEVAAAWVVDLLGLPAGATATFTPGATLANLTGILAGRDALLARAGWDASAQGLFGAPPIRVITGEECHVSALKALRLAGLGVDRVERVPTDATGAVIADAFPGDTDHLTLVVLQAGNVNTGASDPFARIIPRVRERGGWVHVDGAFGMWAAVAPGLRDAVAGMELADSWGTDAHKWLNVPYDSGIAIVRERADLERAMSMRAAYLPETGDREAMHLGMQMSQRARGIETWAMLAANGRDGVADLIGRTCAHARDLAALLEAGGAEILAPVALNQVLVAFGAATGGTGDDAVTDAVIGLVQQEGALWAGGTVWKGRHAMRLSVSDQATTRDDVHVSASAILDAWTRVRG